MAKKKGKNKRKPIKEIQQEVKKKTTGKVDFTKHLDEGFEDTFYGQPGTLKDICQHFHGDKIGPLTTPKSHISLWTQAAEFFILLMFFVGVGIAMKSIV